MKLLLNPYVLLALVLMLAAVGATGYRTGYKHAEQAAAVDKVAALERAIAQAAELASQDAEVLTAHETRRERIRTVFQPIREGVTRYVENHAGADAECLDPDGLRLWRAANAAEAAAAPKPDYAVSGSAAATLGTRGGLAGQPRAGSGDLPRVPGAASGAVGVGEE